MAVGHNASRRILDRRRGGRPGVEGRYLQGRGDCPRPARAGDTLFAASRVLSKQGFDAQAGMIKFHLVGVKNEKPLTLMQAGVDLFKDKFDAKVFEIEREVLLPKQSLFS